jgi:hypothetical protein
MCTVTIIPHGETGGFRILANRDERRSRPAAKPPRVAAFGPRRAAMPIDPQGGGTWIAVNDAGLAMTLLNFYLDVRVPMTGPRSRGLIIPQLLHFDTARDAAKQAALIDTEQYGPFRLVMIDREHVAEITSDGQASCAPRDGRPRLYVSSGLGDDVVAEARGELFNEMFDAPRSQWADRQDALHRHQWPDRPGISVCMSRPQAGTLSMTEVTASGSRVTMRYYGAPPNQSIDPVVVTLDAHRPGGETVD